MIRAYFDNKVELKENNKKNIATATDENNSIDK